jgi:hypothetical protein
VSVAARRKLDRDAGERIVAERGAGRSFRQIGVLPAAATRPRP